MSVINRHLGSGNEGDCIFNNRIIECVPLVSKYYVCVCKTLCMYHEMYMIIYTGVGKYI